MLQLQVLPVVVTVGEVHLAVVLPVAHLHLLLGGGLLHEGELVLLGQVAEELLAGDELRHQGEELDEAEGRADQQQEDAQEADAGVEEGEVVAVHVDQGVDGVLVPVYEGGQDVHGAAHHHGQQQQRHQGLLGPVDEPPPRPGEALALAEEVGEWQQEEERDIGQGEDQVPDAVDEAGVEPLHVPGLGIPVQHLQQTPVETPPTVHCLVTSLLMVEMGSSMAAPTETAREKLQHHSEIL